MLKNKSNETLIIMANKFRELNQNKTIEGNFLSPVYSNKKKKYIFYKKDETQGNLPLKNKKKLTDSEIVL